MLSSPYPVPPVWAWSLVMVLGAIQGLAAGLWVIISPPLSYSDLGLALTTIWGAMTATGSLLVLLAHMIRVHQVEIPGLVIALGGAAIYVYLSWEQTFTSSPGSGPRSLLIGWLASFLLTRLILLVYVDRKARRRKDADG